MNISDNSVKDTVRINSLGKEAERLFEEFNSGLHGEHSKERIMQALADAATLTAMLLALNPAESRKPYYAHQKKIIEFFRSVVEKDT